jgi:hypothetical protein
MKIKIIGIIFCTLIMIHMSVMATSIPKNQNSITLNDDVPTWNVGDSWTYTINNFAIHYNVSGQKMFMDGYIDDFNLNVADTSGTNYKVDFTGKLTGAYDIYFSTTSLTLDVEGTFKPTLTRFKGSIFFSKSDLEIEDITGEIMGITMAKISPLPISLPIPFKLSLDGDFTTKLPIFDFPLHGLKIWALPEIDIIMKAQFGGIFGLINIPVTFQTHYSWTPLAFWCWSMESITVEAGTFDAWRISSIIGDYFEYYYAPSIGNVVKVEVSLPNGDVLGELKTTTITH